MFLKHILGCVLLCGICGSVYAEGSYQVGLNQPLQDYAFTGFSQQVDIVTAGEVINVSLCGAADTDDLSVEILDPDGISVYSSGTLTESNVSCSDPFTAPLTNPLRYTTSKTGSFNIRMENLTLSSQYSVFKRFDISVTPDAFTNPDPTANGGRLWAQTWQYLTGSFGEAGATDADYYALVPGGRLNTNYVWKLDLNKFSGYGYKLMANDLGVDAPYSGYSILVADGNVTPKFPQYLSYPAIANPRPTEPPVLTSGLTFIDDAGQDYAISPGTTNGIQDSGNFEFTSDIAGTYAITIDTNSDGLYGAGDKLLLGIMVAGVNQVSWDGTGPDGSILPVGRYRANLQARLGEYHFISDDVETSGGTYDGLTIYLANSDGSTEDTTVYWDDETYLTGSSILPDGELASTPAGKHTWGDFSGTSLGDTAYIDTYVYGLASAYTATTAIVSDDTLQTGTDGLVTAPATSGPGNDITISLSEPDANILPTVVESITVVVTNGSSGEVEQLTLTETGVNTGIFSIVLTTTDLATAGTNNDGDMNVQVGHTLTSSYQDQLTASGTAASFTADTNIVDVTLPVITLLGSDPVSVEQGTTYTDAGATASDDIDGNLTGGIVTVNPVNTSVVGAYTVTYDVTDAAGNAAAQVTRVVNVTPDATLPVITRLGSDPVNVEQGTTYMDAGATAADSFDGNLTGSIVTVNPVNTSVVGAYTVTYDVTDAAGNAALQVTRVVNVTPDVTLPVITRLGSDPVSVEQGTTYTDAGATASDNIDGDLSASIVTDNPVNTSVVGAYTVTYDVTDAAGNAAVQVTRVVNVTSDATLPVITRLGSDPVSVEQGTSYTDAGATASDNIDGDLSASIVTDNPVNTSVVGAYTVTYDVTDAAGNAAVQVTRVVNVTADATAPVISLLGSDPVDVPLGSPYTDAGATASDDIDGDITADIVTVNPVNTSVVGAYTVTYNVSDATGNAATPVTRTVNVTFDTAADEDGDGIPNGDEGTGDFDGDGVLDFQDLDSDNDGIPDAIEGNADSDSDGVADYHDLDSDNDGLYDLIESGADYAALDTLNDGTIDATNSVGTNGLADAVETLADNATLNYNNGAPLDSDADGVEDYVDLDSDNDALTDVYEAGGSDADGDGVVGSGVPTVDAKGVPTIATALTPIDTDGDGVNDQIDLDTDNDGIMDVVEFAGDDPDGDGQIGTAPSPVDANGLSVDGGLPEVDTDGDGVPNQKDLDSDNDGIPDVTEVGGDDPDGDGVAGTGAPAVNALGIGTILKPVDTDGDTILDPYDPDSDGDGIFDLVEGGGPDTDDDGLVDGFDDPNGDGFDGGVTTTALPLPDGDADGIPDYKDNDDSDNDGIADTIDIDDDNDGIPDALEGDGSIDSDADGIPDSRDLDSDNDGLYDLSEAGFTNPSSMDTDNNGRIDSGLDVGSNGLADDLETSADSGSINYNKGALIDTDGDTVPDFRDLDSDNDSIPDVIEAGGDDDDGDGILGNGTPAVNINGIATGAGQGPVDTDGDGTPDQQDLDADNDGKPDLQEAGGPDSDGNGVVDSYIDTNGDGFDDTIAASPAVLPDTDSDGTPDYRDSAGEPGELTAGLNGIGAFNLWILAVFGLLAGLRQLRGILVSALSVLMLLTVQGEAVAQQALEKESEQPQQDQQHFYIGAGAGRSTLQPDTSGSIYLQDDSDSGTRLYIGADLSSSWSVELSQSDLGSATFQPAAKMDYKVTAVNALYYLYNEGENDHIGMGLYLKAGLGKIDVTADTSYGVNNSSHVALGAGLEYAWENGFAVRADMESFDQDAKLLTLGLLYRFGKPEPAPAPKDSDQDGIFDSSDQCPQTPLQATVDGSGCQLDSDKDGVFDDQDKCPDTVQGVNVDTSGCALDTDGDGVIDELDKCPETAQGASVNSEGCTLDTDKDGVLDGMDLCPDTSIGTKVDKHGCPFFNAPIAGVNFELARGDLTKSAKVELDKAAKVLLEYPLVRIEIQAHTDSQGEIENNQKLSDVRAQSVREYLLTKGIAADRMTAVGYGELKPIVSNKLPEGRAINRRVEFKVLQ